MSKLIAMLGLLSVMAVGAFAQAADCCKPGPCCQPGHTCCKK